MKLSVFRDNQLVYNIDLASEITGIDDSQITFYVGRSENCHVVLDDKRISREHAEIIYKNGIWSIKNLSQFSALIINGNAQAEKELQTGDMVTIDPYVINVSVPEIVTPTVQEDEGAKEDEDLAKEEVSEEMTGDTGEEKQDGESEEMTQSMVNTFEGEEEKEKSEEESAEGDEFEDLSHDAPGEGEEFSGGDSGDEFSQEGTSDEGGEMDAGEASDSEFAEESEVDSEFSQDESYPVETDDGESTKVFQSFAKMDLEIFGEFAPYDRYALEQNETYIGRNADKCQIILKDPEVSGVHAVIKKSNITCVIEDLQSANGTILNGVRINKSTLTNGDEFVIGSTTFTVRVGSEFLETEDHSLMPVEENQVVEVEEVVEVEADFSEDGEEGDLEGQAFGEVQEEKPKSLIEKFKAMPPKKKMIFGGVALILIFFLLDEGGDKKKGKKLDKKKSHRLVKEGDVKGKAKKKGEKVLTKEQLEFVESSYQLAKELFDTGQFRNAMLELEKIFAITPKYKNSQQLYALSKRGFEEKEKREQEKQKELERLERQRKVQQLVEKAKVAVKEHKVPLFKSLYSEVMKLDPENFDMSQLKISLDAWQEEQNRLAIEKAQRKAERKRKERQLDPGKAYYLKKDWYRAIVKLEEFLKIKEMDDDLVQEGTRMLTESRKNLELIVAPLLGKARSLKEGQDLKGAYEHYRDILKHDPINEEALNQMEEIREILYNRSRKIYREAIIYESLSLFNDAKEKYQEVQQVSPADSEYYIKATKKLKEYLE